VSSVRVTQTRSAIGQSPAHEGTLRALGLGRIGKSAEHKQTPALEGKLRHVAHLVTVAPLGVSTGKD
jgi:large subunit ribosomal protein L30